MSSANPIREYNMIQFNDLEEGTKVYAILKDTIYEFELIDKSNKVLGNARYILNDTWGSSNVFSGYTHLLGLYDDVLDINFNKDVYFTKLEYAMVSLNKRNLRLTQANIKRLEDQLLKQKELLHHENLKREELSKKFTEYYI